MVKRFKKSKLKFFFLFLLVFITVLLAIYQRFVKTSFKNVIFESFTLKHYDFDHNIKSISYSSFSSFHTSPFSSSSSPKDFNKCTVLTKPFNISTDTTYDFPDFDTYNLGFWNGTIEDRYLKKIKKKEFPIKLILMLHSHADPGWLKTFEGYYTSLVEYILDNLVYELTIHPNLTFIWSEVSFLDRWWKSIEDKPEIKKSFIRLIQRGQLELVSGGWVMTDEAVSHYYSMIDQLIEGHQWIRTNLGIDYPPNNSWSCDPFGHSGTYPYFLQKAGIKNMIIQRTHFAWKAKLAMQESFEFWWSQTFLKVLNFNSKNSIFCHVMPFDIYNFKHGCGPSTKVCLQFDFRKVPGEYSESQSVPIDEKNLEEKAKTLLGQYGRTASLFRHNVALIPLGDDFRYNSRTEWDQQRTNFELLINYINSNKAKFNNTEIQFGTLKDYFDEVELRSKHLKNFPSLIGDFFPYADHYASGLTSYWTGYYTSNPFWKKLGRDLEHCVRSAEIIYTLAHTDAIQRKKTLALKKLNNDYQYLTLARQNLGLFQHHDAITGTSKRFVMQDYGKRMHRSIIDSFRIMSNAIHYFLMSEKSNLNLDKTQIFPVLQMINYDENFNITLIKISSKKKRKLFVFNSHLQSVQLPLRFRISNPFILILDSQTGLKIPFQVAPVWSNLKIKEKEYEVIFIPKLKPLSLTTFDIVIDHHLNNNSQSNISYFLVDYLQSQQIHDRLHHYNRIFKIQNPPHQDFELSSPFFTAIFDRSSGFLKAIRDKQTQKEYRVNFNLYYYNSKSGFSGAYLFETVTEDSIKIFDPFPIFKLNEGKAFNELIVSYLDVFEIIFRVYQTSSPIGASIYIEPRVDLREKEEFINKEVFMRFESDIKNFDKKYSSQIFYTDSNGFQSIPRLYNPEIGIWGNYYPMTSHIYIEDNHTRLTLLSLSSHGSSSTTLGSMEVMLDRKLEYDDARGVAEALINNNYIQPKFLLLLENLVEPKFDYTVSSLSFLANYLSFTFLYPPIMFLSDGYEENLYNSHRNFIKHPISCAVNLVNLRTLPLFDNYDSPSISSLLLLHNRSSTCSIDSLAAFSFCEEPNYNSIELENLTLSSIEETSLTGLIKLKLLKDLSQIKVMPMELASFNLTFSSS